jgi:hypothetical protein
MDIRIGNVTFTRADIKKARDQLIALMKKELLLYYQGVIYKINHSMPISDIELVQKSAAANLKRSYTCLVYLNDLLA